MNSLITRYDPRDWHYGDGNIKLRGTGNPDWTGNYWFPELQKIGGFDTEDCVVFGAQESFDAQVDRLISQGEVDKAIVDWFTLNGYMDSVNSSDGKPHFHTSERFTALNTGNGFNGNAGQDPWNAMRNFGCIPWTDWPFDASVTSDHYFDKPPQTLYDKGLLFLAQIGGKNAIQYHWVFQGNDANRALMDVARATAPLCLGVATTDGWNQDAPTPPPIGTPPNHMVDNINRVGDSEVIYDHYVPFIKEFGLNYPIPQVLQGVVSISPPPPAPTLPSNPTQAQTTTWLQNVVSWLWNIIESITPEGRAKLGGASRSPHWEAFKKEFAKTHLPVCAVCGKSGRKAKLELHHLYVFHAYPEYELSEWNLRWLCPVHHLWVGHLGNFKSVNPNGITDIPFWRDKIRNRPMSVEEIKKVMPPPPIQ